MILFVNGYTLGCEPLRPYWSSSRKDPDEFIDAAKRYFRDEHVSSASFINGSGDWFGSKAWSRQSYGRKLGINIAVSIREQLVKGETIKIVSHSMGAATAEGIIETFRSLLLPIEKVIHFCPSNANRIHIHPTTSDVERIQINATGDRVIEHFADPFSDETELVIPGVSRYGKVKWDPWKLHPKHIAYLKDRNLPFDLDAHFDLKTYAFVFQWVEDLEAMCEGGLIGTRDHDGKKREVSLFRRGPNKTEFDQIYIKRSHYSYLEPYQFDVSDKFLLTKKPVQ